MKKSSPWAEPPEPELLPDPDYPKGHQEKPFKFLSQEEFSRAIKAEEDRQHNDAISLIFDETSLSEDDENFQQEVGARVLHIVEALEASNFREIVLEKVTSKLRLVPESKSLQGLTSVRLFDGTPFKDPLCEFYALMYVFGKFCAEKYKPLSDHAQDKKALFNCGIGKEIAISLAQNFISGFCDTASEFGEDEDV